MSLPLFFSPRVWKRSLLLCVAFIVGSISLAVAQPTPDSLQRLAQGIDQTALQQQVERLGVSVEALETMRLELAVARQLQALQVDTLDVEIDDLSTSPDHRAWAGRQAEALAHTEGLISALEQMTRYAEAAAQVAAPRTLQPLTIEDSEAERPTSHLRQVTDVAQPLLLGVGTVIRSESTTLSTLLIAGGVASAVVGFVTAPEVERTPAGVGAQLREAATRTGSPAVSARQEVEAHRALLQAYEQRARQLSTELATLRRTTTSLRSQWEQESARPGVLAGPTRTMSRQLQQSLDETSRLLSELQQAGQRIGFSLDIYTRADPRLQTTYAPLRDRNRVFLQTYSDRVRPALTATTPALREVLTRWSTAQLPE